MKFPLIILWNSSWSWSDVFIFVNKFLWGWEIGANVEGSFFLQCTYVRNTGKSAWDTGSWQETPFKCGRVYKEQSEYLCHTWYGPDPKPTEVNRKTYGFQIKPRLHLHYNRYLLWSKNWPFLFTSAWIPLIVFLSFPLTHTHSKILRMGGKL